MADHLQFGLTTSVGEPKLRRLPVCLSPFSYRRQKEIQGEPVATQRVDIGESMVPAIDFIDGVKHCCSVDDQCVRLDFMALFDLSQQAAHTFPPFKFVTCVRRSITDTTSSSLQSLSARFPKCKLAFSHEIGSSSKFRQAIDASMIPSLKAQTFSSIFYEDVSSCKNL